MRRARPTAVCPFALRLLILSITVLGWDSAASAQRCPDGQFWNGYECQDRVEPGAECGCRSTGVEPSCVDGGGSFWYVHVGGQRTDWVRGSDARCCAARAHGRTPRGGAASWGGAPCVYARSRAGCEAQLSSLGCAALSPPPRPPAAPPTPAPLPTPENGGNRKRALEPVEPMAGIYRGRAVTLDAYGQTWEVKPRVRVMKLAGETRVTVRLQLGSGTTDIFLRRSRLPLAGGALDGFELRRVDVRGEPIDDPMVFGSFHASLTVESAERVLLELGIGVCDSLGRCSRDPLPLDLVAPTSPQKDGYYTAPPFRMPGTDQQTQLHFFVAGQYFWVAFESGDAELFSARYSFRHEGYVLFSDPILGRGSFVDNDRVMIHLEDRSSEDRVGSGETVTVFLHKVDPEIEVDATYAIDLGRPWDPGGDEAWSFAQLNLREPVAHQIPRDLRFAWQFFGTETWVGDARLDHGIFYGEAHPESGNDRSVLRVVGGLDGDRLVLVTCGPVGGCSLDRVAPNAPPLPSFGSTATLEVPACGEDFGVLAEVLVGAIDLRNGGVVQPDDSVPWQTCAQVGLSREGSSQTLVRGGCEPLDDTGILEGELDGLGCRADYEILIPAGADSATLAVGNFGDDDEAVVEATLVPAEIELGSRKRTPFCMSAAWLDHPGHWVPPHGPATGLVPDVVVDEDRGRLEVRYIQVGGTPQEQPAECFVELGVPAGDAQSVSGTAKGTCGEVDFRLSTHGDGPRLRLDRQTWTPPGSTAVDLVDAWGAPGARDHDGAERFFQGTLGPEDSDWIRRTPLAWIHPGDGGHGDVLARSQVSVEVLFEQSTSERRGGGPFKPRQLRLLKAESATLPMVGGAFYGEVGDFDTVRGCATAEGVQVWTETFLGGSPDLPTTWPGFAVWDRPSGQTSDRKGIDRQSFFVPEVAHPDRPWRDGTRDLPLIDAAELDGAHADDPWSVEVTLDPVNPGAIWPQYAVSYVSFRGLLEGVTEPARDRGPLRGVARGRSSDDSEDLEIRFELAFFDLDGDGVGDHPLMSHQLTEGVTTRPLRDAMGSETVVWLEETSDGGFDTKVMAFSHRERTRWWLDRILEREEVLSATVGQRARPASARPSDHYFNDQPLRYLKFCCSAEQGGPPSDGWDFNRGAGVTIAVLDSGVDWDHPDLMTGPEGNRRSKVVAYDAVWGLPGWDPNRTRRRLWVPDPAADRPFATRKDPTGHGTAIFGILVAEHNRELISGAVPEAKALSFRVGSRGYKTAAIAKALEWIAESDEPRVDIVSISWHMRSDPLITTLVDRLHQQGILVVAASGNHMNRNDPKICPGSETRDTVCFPSSLPGVVSVGSINGDLSLSGYSHRGISLDVVMPGGEGLDSEYEAQWDPGSGGAPNVSAVSDAMGRGLGLLPTLWSRRGEFNPGSRGHDREMAWVLGTSYAAPHFVAVAATALAGGNDPNTGTPLSVGPDLKRRVGGGCVQSNSSRQCVELLREFLTYPRNYQSLPDPLGAAFPMPVATEVTVSAWDFLRSTPVLHSLTARPCDRTACPDDSSRGLLLEWQVDSPNDRLSTLVYRNGELISWVRDPSATRYHYDVDCNQGANSRERYHFQVSGVEHMSLGSGFHYLETAGTRLVTVDCTDGIYLVQ